MCLLICAGALTYAAMSLLVVRTRTLQVLALIRSILTERRTS
jgi:hypothetical protein